MWRAGSGGASLWNVCDADGFVHADEHLPCALCPRRRDAGSAVQHVRQLRRYHVSAVVRRLDDLFGSPGAVYDLPTDLQRLPADLRGNARCGVLGLRCVREL